MERRMIKSSTIRKSRIVICIAALAFVFSCAEAPKKTGGDLICVEHGTHRVSVKEDFAACFGIDPQRFNEYYYYTKAETFPANEQAEGAKRLKDMVESEIVDTIMNRLEAAFEKALNANWQLEQIDMPVPFRTFVRKNGGSVDIKVVGVVRKKDLEPSALVHFLPLEYKMKILDDDGKIRPNIGNP